MASQGLNETEAPLDIQCIACDGPLYRSEQVNVLFGDERKLVYREFSTIEVFLHSNAKHEGFLFSAFSEWMYSDRRDSDRVPEDDQQLMPLIMCHKSCLELFVSLYTSEAERIRPAEADGAVAPSDGRMVEVDEDGRASMAPGADLGTKVAVGVGPRAEDALVRRKREDAEAALWGLGCFQYSWMRPYRFRGALVFKLDRAYPLADVDQDVLARLAQQCGLPRLARLPLEVVEQIRQKDPFLPFWNTLAVHAKVAKAAWTCQTLAEVRLRALGRWERGSPVVERRRRRPAEEATQTPGSPARPSDNDAILRLTIDTDGVARIERLATWPPPNPATHVLGKRSTTTRVYVVQHEDVFAGVDAQIKGSHLLRLTAMPCAHDRSAPPLPLWDVPYPPDLRDCFLSPQEHQQRRHPWTLFKTVDLAATRGLTFLMHHNRIQAVVAHDAANPSVSPRSLYRQFSNLSHTWMAKVVWQHVPIAPGDRVTALGVQKRCDGNNGSGRNHVYIRLQLAGDVFVGNYVWSAPAQADLVGCSFSEEDWNNNHATMIYDVPQRCGAVVHVGAYHRRRRVSEDEEEKKEEEKEEDEKEEESMSKHNQVGNDPRRPHIFPLRDDGRCFAMPVCDWQTTPGYDTYVSSAPLKGARIVEVFYRVYNNVRFCQGLLITYGLGGSGSGCHAEGPYPGAQRALGQCRMGIDDSVVYTRPTTLCIRRVPQHTFSKPQEAPNGVAVELRSHSDKPTEGRANLHYHQTGDWVCHTMDGYLSMICTPTYTMIKKIEG